MRELLISHWHCLLPAAGLLAALLLGGQNRSGPGGKDGGDGEDGG